MDYSAPQIAGREESFHSAIREYLKRYTQRLEDPAIEILAGGLLLRDIDVAFKDEADVSCCPERRSRNSGNGCGRTIRASSSAG